MGQPEIKTERAVLYIEGVILSSNKSLLVSFDCVHYFDVNFVHEINWLELIESFKEYYLAHVNEEEPQLQGYTDLNIQVTHWERI